MQPAKPRIISIITTSRADYGHLLWTLRAIEQHPLLSLDLIVCGSHLSTEFGFSVDQVQQDGFTNFTILKTLCEGDKDTSMVETLALSIFELGKHLSLKRPDILLVIADRYEMLAPASVALCLGIPIAHIEGGDISQGALDDQVRNALTKMSHLHFVPSSDAYQRVIAMGEAPWRVEHAGALSLDNLKIGSLPSLAKLQSHFEFQLSENYFLICMHPVTLSTAPCDDIMAVLDALSHFGKKYQFIFCFPNADKGYRLIIDQVTRFCSRIKNAELIVQLEHQYFWTMMKHARLMIGNSSSGIMETPSLRLATLNVGDRQKGRLQAKNIIQCTSDTQAITAAIRQALSNEFQQSLQSVKNPYDSGKIASQLIANKLAQVPLGMELLRKEFYPVIKEEQYFFKILP